MIAMASILLIAKIKYNGNKNVEIGGLACV